MTLDELTLKLGNCCAIEMAQSKYSKHDALTKIVDTIKKKGVDVDDEYLDFIESLEYQSVYVDVKYVPLYCCTCVAKFSWKEFDEGSDPTDHQEFCRFSTVFYGKDNDASDRINKLNILNVVDKTALNINESKCDETVLRIGTNNPDCDISKLPAQSEVIMDSPVKYGEYYDLDTDYLCSQEEIQKRVQVALEQTKSYKRLQKEKEKWSNIVKIDTKVILVPIASLQMGDEYQLVNCTNGTMDVVYKENATITSQLNKAKMITYPSIIIFALCSIAAYLCKTFTHSNKQWGDFGLKYIFANLYDIMWIVIFLFGIIVSIIALPTRKTIVKRTEKNKNVLTVVKISSRMILDAILLMILMIVLCFSI